MSGGRKNRRSKRVGGKFVMLEEYLQKTASWRALDTVARCIFVEMLRCYNGHNNGEIAMSCRRAADLVNTTKSTAARALVTLQKHGFIRIARQAQLVWRDGTRKRFATSYALTHLPVGNALPTKDFIRWTPDGTPNNVIPMRTGAVA